VARTLDRRSFLAAAGSPTTVTGSGRDEIAAPRSERTSAQAGQHGPNAGAPTVGEQTGGQTDARSRGAEGAEGEPVRW